MLVTYHGAPINIYILYSWVPGYIIGTYFSQYTLWYLHFFLEKGLYFLGMHILNLGVHKSPVHPLVAPMATCSSSMCLTTNACESFHSKFNWLLYTSHPSIFQFLEILKQCQTDAKLKIQFIICTPRETTKQINKKKIMQTQITKLRNFKISNFDFVKIMSFKNLPSL
jgi:hypothetical protein